MTQNPSDPATEAKSLNRSAVFSMRARVYYSQRTAGAKYEFDSVLPLMKEALDRLPSSKGPCFLISGSQAREQVCRFGRS